MAMVVIDNLSRANKGVKIGGQWYDLANPDAIEHITKGQSYEVHIKGKMAKVLIPTEQSAPIERNNESNPKLSQSAPELPEEAVRKVMSKEDYWANKETFDIERDTRISRAGALNTAISILEYQLKVVQEKNKVGGSDLKKEGSAGIPTTTSEIIKNAELIADEILKWLNKK